METLLLKIIQVVVAFGLLNVWLLRRSRPTIYRGGDAKNIVEEFAVYGLPAWFCYLIGFLKVSAAVCLLVGLWVPSLTLPAATLIAALMLGAVSMHFKVRDPIKKTLPALSMLVLNLAIIAIAVS